MNNDIFKRLYALFERLGINLQGGSAQRAELLGYCAALTLADKEINNHLQNIFLETADNKGLSMLLGMTGAKRGETDGDTKNAIISACTDGGRFLSKEDFENALFTAFPGADYYVNGTDFIFNPSTYFDREMLSVLSEFIKGYAPACYRFTLNGEGVPWEILEYPELCWHEIDSLALPFSVWDTIY